MELESVMNSKVKPILDTAMKKYLGVTINEIKSDISDRIKSNPLLDFEIDTSKTYKNAKRDFRRFYFLKLLNDHFGNVSQVAEVAGLDRRSVHRIIKALKIDVDQMRKERRPYVRQETVKDIIRDTLDNYKTSLNPEKIQMLYERAPALSQDIVELLPELPLTLDEAEDEFDRQYLMKALREFEWNITKTAKHIKLRAETIHRKIKDLGIAK